MERTRSSSLGVLSTLATTIGSGASTVASESVDQVQDERAGAGAETRPSGEGVGLGLSGFNGQEEGLLQDAREGELWRALRLPFDKSG